MSRNKIKKIALFYKGIEALKSIGVNDGKYYCPICFNLFKIQAVEENLLSLEHVPPEKQGGKGLILTCHKCNTTAGRSVDAAVNNRIEMEKFYSLFQQRGVYEGACKIDLGVEELNGLNYEIQVRDSRVRFYPRGNHPDTANKMIDHFKEIPNLSLKCTPLTKFNVWHSKVGDLRTAFLVAFASLGYRYAADNRLTVVRDQIINYQEKLIDYFWLKQDNLETEGFGLYLLDQPFSALGVKIANSFVILPWLNSPVNFYESISKSPPRNPVTLKMTQCRWPATMEMRLDFLRA